MKFWFGPPGIANLEASNHENDETWRRPAGVPVEDAIATYKNDPNVLWAQPNYIYHLTVTPNDYSFNYQWALNNTGQYINSIYGTSDADIDSPETWDTFTGPAGSDNVVVAVIDSGVDYNHPDLINNLAYNAGETGTDSYGNDKKTNGIDDDGNGLPDDWLGWNFIGMNNNVADDTGHGTHCAGIIGAVGNNEIGVTGVNWNVKVLPVKAFNNQGGATTYWIMQALTYAHEIRGATILSGSFGSYFNDSPDYYIRDYISWNPDVLFVFSAGNDIINTDGDMGFYPACYNSTNIISVAASDQNDILSIWIENGNVRGSNFGVRTVDLTAPGTNIFSTLPSTMASYGYKNGTSMATPYVTGVAGLIQAINPYADPVVIKNAILQNVDQKSSLVGRVNSSGRLNANRALSSVSVMVPPIPDFSANPVSGTALLTVQFTDTSTGARLTTWSWNFGDGSTSPMRNPSHTFAAGTYTVSLTTGNNAGQNTTTKTNYITVNP